MGNISQIDKNKDLPSSERLDKNNLQNDMSISYIDNIVEDLFSDKENFKNLKIEVKINEQEQEAEYSYIKKERERDLKLIHLSKEKVEIKDHIFETDFPGDDLENEIKINSNLLLKNNNLNNIYRKELMKKNSEKNFMKIVDNDLNNSPGKDKDKDKNFDCISEKDKKNKNEESFVLIKRDNSLVKLNARSVSVRKFIKRFIYLFKRINQMKILNWL